MKTLYNKYIYFVSLSSMIVFVRLAICQAQLNPDFNINMNLDFTAAEQCLSLFEDQQVNTQYISELRGNRIAVSTTGLISSNNFTSIGLQSYLDSLKYHQIIKDDIYHLEEARKNDADIRQLLDELKKRNFSRRVAATVEQIFPNDAKVSLEIPVYFVSLGHENVDAYVRRVVWHDNVPQFVGENQGELTIVVNLAQSVKYGSNTDERFITLLGVVAHEVFHAAFSDFKKNSQSWKEYYSNNQYPIDALLDLTQNEGIAYYLSLIQQVGDYIPRDWSIRTRESMATFNKNSTILLSDTVNERKFSELLRKANLSGYWESYGSITGMLMAREIDVHLGRAALIETIASNPIDFFVKYIKLSQNDSNLPQLSRKLIDELSKKQHQFGN